MAEVKWRLSSDGKTVIAGGKTYSLSAFKKQFTNIDNSSKNVRGSNAIQFGSGTADTRSGATVKKVSSSTAKTADEAKSKYEKKAAKKAASSIKAASKPVKTAAAAKAREAAKKRAALTAPNKRSSGQKFTIRGGGAGGAFLENLK